jgi:hypothetical protein
MVIVFNLMSHQILLSRRTKSCYMQDIHKSTSMKVEGGDKEVMNFDQVVLFAIMIYSKQYLIHETLARGKKFQQYLIFLKPIFHDI